MAQQSRAFFLGSGSSPSLSTTVTANRLNISYVGLETELGVIQGRSSRNVMVKNQKIKKSVSSLLEIEGRTIIRLWNYFFKMDSQNDILCSVHVANKPLRNLIL